MGQAGDRRVLPLMRPLGAPLVRWKTPSDGTDMRPEILNSTDAQTTLGARSVSSHMREGAVLSSFAATVGWCAFVFTSQPAVGGLIATALFATIPGVVAGGLFHALFAGRTPRRPVRTLAVGAALAAVTAVAAFVNYVRVFTVTDPGPIEEAYAWLAAP